MLDSEIGNDTINSVFADFTFWEVALTYFFNF